MTTNPNPHGGPPITFTGSRGPSTNVPANPVVHSPQAGPGPDPAPAESIEHTPLGMKPRIQYQPGTISDPPQVSIGDIHHDFGENPAPTVDTPSDAPIGALGDGDADIGAIGHQASGTRVDLFTPPNDLPTPISGFPATSPVAGEVPWENPAKPYTTPTTQVFSPGDGARIGVIRTILDGRDD